MPKDDPTELFDLCDADGRPLGRSKERALVHRDGDWHRSVHLWIVLAGAAGPHVLFQRRSLGKDTHPGKVDVSVAGHLAAGESTEAALREAREEIGLALHASDLLRLGTRRREDIGDGRADREVQELFFAVAASGLECLMPDPDEVMGLLTVPLPDALALVRGEREATAARELHRGGEAVVAVELRRGELLLSPDGYFEAALDAISRRLAGDLSAGLAKTSG